MLALQGHAVLGRRSRAACPWGGLWVCVEEGGLVLASAGQVEIVRMGLGVARA